jgi:Holliday junction resolvase RusA-like endonuclease
MIQIHLAGAPKGKAAMSSRNGVRYLPSSTRDYMTALRLAAQEAMITHGLEELLQGPIAVVVRADLPVPDSWSKKKKGLALDGTMRPTAKPDADNIAKMMDAFNGVVWHDDKQIAELYIRKDYSEKPGLTVTVSRT